MLPTYAFVSCLLIVIGIGIWKCAQSGGHPAPVTVPPTMPRAVEAMSAWLLIRAFASGCTAMTGVEAVSNAVPIFADPAVKNARRTLGIICAILGLLLGGIGYLVHAYQIGAMPQEQPGYQSIISQLVAAVAGRGAVYYVAIGATLSVLALSANTSFADFPRLCRLLAEDRYLPSGFSNLGRRLVYSLGIVILAILSAILLIIFDGITDRLIPLFAVGAFGAFTMSQAGMVMHWLRKGRGAKSPSMYVNAIGAITTGATLVVIIAAKFAEGAWITVLIIPGLVWSFARIRKHYAGVARETRPPLEIHAGEVQSLKVLIPVEGWNRVTERALVFALKISDDITALHVSSAETDEAICNSWRVHVAEPAKKAGLPEPRLEIVKSPYRTFFKPLLDYILRCQKEEPDRLIAVIIPELVLPRWWEYILHNHVASALKAMLLLNGDERVVVINTPWYLRERKPDKQI